MTVLYFARIQPSVVPADVPIADRSVVFASRDVYKRGAEASVSESTHIERYRLPPGRDTYCQSLLVSSSRRLNGRFICLHLSDRQSASCICDLLRCRLCVELAWSSVSVNRHQALLSAAVPHCRRSCPFQPPQSPRGPCSCIYTAVFDCKDADDSAAAAPAV